MKLTVLTTVVPLLLASIPSPTVASPTDGEHTLVSRERILELRSLLRPAMRPPPEMAADLQKAKRHTTPLPIVQEQQKKSFLGFKGRRADVAKLNNRAAVAMERSLGMGAALPLPIQIRAASADDEDDDVEDDWDCEDEEDDDYSTSTPATPYTPSAEAASSTYSTPSLTSTATHTKQTQSSSAPQVAASSSDVAPATWESSATTITRTATSKKSAKATSTHHGKSTSTASASATVSIQDASNFGLVTPVNLATGSLTAEEGCIRFHTVVSGEVCLGLLDYSKDISLTLEQLYQYNPAINSDCTNLQIGWGVCIGM